MEAEFDVYVGWVEFFTRPNYLERPEVLGLAKLDPTYRCRQPRLLKSATLPSVDLDWMADLFGTLTRVGQQNARWRRGTAT